MKPVLTEEEYDYLTKILADKINHLRDNHKMLIKSEGTHIESIEMNTKQIEFASKLYRKITGRL